MKLLLIFLATAYAAAPAPPAPLAPEGRAGYEPIGYEQPALDRYSYDYGNPEQHGYGGLLEVPVPYVIGRQGIGFDKRTAFAYGFRMPPTHEIYNILRRYPDKQELPVKA